MCSKQDVEEDPSLLLCPDLPGSPYSGGSGKVAEVQRRRKKGARLTAAGSMAFAFAFAFAFHLCTCEKLKRDGRVSLTFYVLPSSACFPRSTQNAMVILLKKNEGEAEQQ